MGEDTLHLITFSIRPLIQKYYSSLIQSWLRLRYLQLAVCVWYSLENENIMDGDDRKIPDIHAILGGVHLDGIFCPNVKI